MANNGFSINVGTILDASNIPKDLEKIQAKLTKAIDIPIKIKDVDKSTGEEVWTKAVKSLRTYKDELGNTYNTIVKLNQEGKNFIHLDGTVEQEKLRKITEGTRTLTTEVHKWTDSKGAIQTWTTTVDSSGQKVSTRIKEVIDEFGRITKTTTKLASEGAGKPFHKIGEDIVEISDLLKEVTTTTTKSFGQITDTIDGVTKTFNGTITTIKKVQSDGQELITTIGKYTNDAGQAVEVTKQFNQEGIQVGTTQRKITQDLTNTGNALKSTSKNIDIIKNSAGEIVKTIITINEQGERLRTTITTSDNGLGRLTTTTRVYNETLQKEVSLHQESVNNQVKEQEALEQQNRLKQQLLTTTTQEEHIITRNNQALWATVTTTKEQTHEYGEVTTRVIQYTDALGNLVTETTKEDAQGRALAQSTKTVEQQMNKTANATNRMGNAAKSSSNGVKTLGSSFASALAQLTRFYVASLPLRAITTVISEAKSAVKDFDEAITEMGKVSDYSGEKLRKYTENLGNLGKEVARTRTEMTEATTGWLKAGYSEEDAAQLAKISSLLQNTADEELSAAEATSILVSQLKAYHMEADEAIRVTDIINAVSAEQAVSSADIAKGLTVASASMATFGNSIEETTALLTAGTTIFQGRSQQVARGLNMIATRVSKNEDALKKYDVAVKDSNGELRSTYDILSDLAPKWEKMSKSEQVALGNTLAGTNQYKILAAIMSQMKPELDGLSVAQKAYNQAMESSGKTMQQNAVYMESIEAKTTALKAEFENLVISKGGLQDLAKFFIDLGTGTLKLVNTLGGLKSVLTVLAGVILTVKADTLVKNFNKLTTSITTLIPRLVTAIGYFREGRASGLAFGDALKAAGIKASVAQVAIGALTTVISIAVIAWGAYQASVEKANAALEQSRQEYEQYINSLESSVSKIKSENTSKKELIQINKDLKGSYEGEKQALIDVNDLRKENLHLLYQESKQKANEYIAEHADEAIKAQEYLNHTVKDSGILFGQLTKLLTTQTLAFGSSAGAITTVRNELDKIIALSPDEAYSKLTEKINELTKIQEENGSLTENQKLQLEEYTKALNTIKAQTDEAKVALEAYNNAKQVATQTEEEFIKAQTTGIEFDELTIEELNELQEKYSITEEEIQALIESEDGLNYTRSEAIQLLAAQKEASQNYQQTAEELEETLNTLAQTLGITATELNVLKEKFDDVTLITFLTNLAKVKQELNDTSTVIDNLQGALEAATTALEEYNQNGYLTIDTFQSLMGISARYLAALVNENGQLEINQTTLGNLIEQLKIAKIEELQEAAAMEIAANHTQAASTASANAVGNVANIGNTIQTTGNQAATAAGKVATFADEVSRLSGVKLGDMTSQDKKILDNYKKIANEIANITVNTTKAGNAASKAGKKGSGAAKQAKNATKELNKELEDTKSKYEKVISWISKQYDKEIDKIKKAKDEAVNAEDEKIKAKEKEKDTALDAIEAEIRALEREKNELKAQKEVLDERKNALKDEEDTIVKGIEKRIKVLEKERDALIKPIEERIKALEKERDAIIDSTQAEIDSINEIKEKRQTYWDDQINALKEANKELKDNLELQEKLDALEKAKNTKVKVYKEGQGFVYDVDQNAVQQAQKALDEYLSQKAYEDELARLEALKNAEIKSYEDRVKELTKYKDNTKKTYDQQIEDLKNYKDSLKENYTEQIDNLKEYKETVQEQYEEQIELLNQDIDALERHMEELDKHKDALEEHKDAVEEQFEAEISALEAHKDEVERAYDAEIQAWEGYKQGFEDMVNAYEEQQNRLLFEQLTGIKDESNNWMTRLDNLAEFVRKYNELQKQLDTDNTDVSNNASMKEGSTPSSSYSNGYTSSNRTVTNYNTSTNRLGGDAQYTPSYSSGGNGRYGTQPTFSSAALEAARKRVSKHAKGVSSVANNEVALVGDSPNQELVIGSKLNGSLMSLDKGTGVVNANSATTLAGMLNQVGKYGASGFGSGGGTLNNNYNNDSLTINGVTIQGSNISSPETFVNGLLNLKAEALQRAYRHR